MLDTESPDITADARAITVTGDGERVEVDFARPGAIVLCKRT